MSKRMVGWVPVTLLACLLLAGCDDGFDGSGQPQSPEYFARIVASCVAREGVFYGETQSWEQNLTACVRWARCLGSEPYLLALERQGVTTRQQYDLASGGCASDPPRPDHTGLGRSGYAESPNQAMYMNMMERVVPDRFKAFLACLSEGEPAYRCEVRVDFRYPSAGGPD
jgi:hypothetical protein